MDKLSMILDQLLFHWPWVLLLLPMPWLFRKVLKPAKQFGLLSDHQVLKTPFFKQIKTFEKIQNNTKKNTAWWVYGIWCLLVIGLTRPYTILDELPVPTKARDIMIAIDLSGSMQKNYLTNGRANRLDVVKAAADTFIQRRPKDRVGLVFFSDRAYVQSPLTLDNQLVRKLLTEAQVGLTGNNTAIGDAIAIALKRFKQSVENNKYQQSSIELKIATDNSQKQKPANNYNNKVLVLLTDGTNTAGSISPKSATQLAQKMGVKIYTIGVGKEIRRGFTDRKELDETLLKWIAKNTQGKFFRAQDKSALDRVYEAIDSLEPTDQSPKYFKIEKEWFHYPIGLALIVTLLWFFLEAIRRFFRDYSIKK